MSDCTTAPEQTPTHRDGHSRRREGLNMEKGQTATPSPAVRTLTNKKNLNETEASEQYGPSVHWFRRARWAGNGPRFCKLAGAVYYPVTELDAFFDARLVKSTSEASTRRG